MPEWWEGDPIVSGDGLLAAGNIDLGNRPRVRNRDGSVSTVRSISVDVDGREYLIPTVSDDGRILTDDQAYDLFRKTGKHLGAFDSPASATAYAKRLHDDQAGMISTDAMRPMVAHTPHEHGSWWESDPLVQAADADEPRIPIGIDPRMEPESYFPADDVRDATLGGYADYAGMATAPTMMNGARAIASGAARSRLRPIITNAAIGGGVAAMSGGNVTEGALYGAVAGAAGMGASARAATKAASEAAPDAAALLKVARSASATSAERIAARAALQKMGWVPEAEKAAEAAAETAAPVARKLASTPTKGNVKPATVYTKPDPVQGPKPLTEMQIVTRGRQEEAAKAAGMSLDEAFGTGKAVSKGAQVAAQHKALMSFGKEVAKRNPKVGEKIWLLLDDAGNPVKGLTPAEAGAAARKGLKTTWVKNLWAN